MKNKFYCLFFSVLFLPITSFAQTGSIGTAREEFRNRDAAIGNLPENVSPPSEITRTNETPTCPGEMPYLCRYVMWDTLVGNNGYIDGRAAYGNDQLGIFRHSDSIVAFYNERYWEAVAILGYDINESGQLCGCMRTFHGCFDPEVRIRMADGTDKPIKDLSAGESVLNPVTGKTLAIKRIIEGAEQQALIQIGYDEISLKVTQNHPIWTLTEASNNSVQLQKISLNEKHKEKNYSVKKASEIKLGDLVLGKDGGIHKVTTLNKLPIKQKQFVINLELDSDSKDYEDHFVLSDGIATGDFQAQLMLEGANQN